MLDRTAGLLVLLPALLAGAARADGAPPTQRFECRVGITIDRAGPIKFEYRLRGTVLLAPAGESDLLDEPSLRLDVIETEYPAGTERSLLTAAVLELTGIDENDDLVFRTPASRYGLEVSIDRPAGGFSVRHTLAPGRVFTAAGDCLRFPLGR